MPSTFEHSGHKPQYLGVIIHDQNPRSAHGSPLWDTEMRTRRMMGRPSQMEQSLMS